MTISTYIVDDEPHALDILNKYIRQTPGLSLIGSSLDPRQAFAEITAAVPPDIIFLDIDMPYLSGLELAGLIAQHSRVIFTTSYRQYGAEAFDYNALDFLPKPFSYERFLTAIQKFTHNKVFKEPAIPAETAVFFVNGGMKGKLVRVRPDEIFYIEGAQNFLRLHPAKEPLIVYLTFSEILAQLPPGLFIRIHKSFAVNLRLIRSIEGGQVRLENQTVLPIGRTYQESFQKLLHDHILSTQRSH